MPKRTELDARPLLATLSRQGYDDLAADAVGVDLGDGLVVAMASIRDVIRMKETAAREKDFVALPALRRTLELIREAKEN